MTWNYRIGTKVFSYKKKFEEKNKDLAKFPDSRLFSIIELYYDENNIPNGYTEPNVLSDWETLEDLIGTIDFVKLALEKPIIDLDNFPNEWVEVKKELTEEESKHITELIVKTTKSF